MKKKKTGHTETSVLTVVRKIESGKWLSSRLPSLKKLSAGLRLELKRFPKTTANRFVNHVVATVALSEFFATAFSEDRRVKDLEEMIDGANQFGESCTRTRVLFSPMQPNYSLTPQESADKLGALVSETEDLRHARKKALVAVCRYRLRLEAALKTARRRSRGEKRTVDETGFFGKIACKYRDEFKVDPVSTPGGTFSNIVMRIRAHQTGKDVKNVERVVRAALKKI